MDAGKVGFGAKFMAKINELKNKPETEKAQMQADLNSALKGNFRGSVGGNYQGKSIFS